MRVRRCFGFNLAMACQSSHLVPSLMFSSSAFSILQTFQPPSFIIVKNNFSPLS